MTGNIWNQVNRLLPNKQRKIACIAYVTSEQLHLGEGDVLICDASTFAIKFGETSAKTLAVYFKKGVGIYSHKQLHAKFLLTEDFLVIGSANLSKSSAERLTEASVVTTNPVLLSQAKAFCYSLQKESKPLTWKHIETLLNINVVRRPQHAVKGAQVRKKKFGHQCWFVSVHPLSSRTYDAIKTYVEERTTSISKEAHLDDEAVHFIQWKAQNRVYAAMEVGDEIIIRDVNKSKTRSSIYPPATILKKEVADGFSYVYYNGGTSDAAAISWTTFQRLIKAKGIGITFTGKNKRIPANEVKKLRQLWETLLKHKA